MGVVFTSLPVAPGAREKGSRNDLRSPYERTDTGALGEEPKASGYTVGEGIRQISGVTSGEAVS